MENKLEPGPWELGGCSGRMIKIDGYGFIADVDTLANAKLIAAAPELLEVLIEITETFKSCLGGSDPLYFEDFKDEINKAEQIIKKATE